MRPRGLPVRSTRHRVLVWMACAAVTLSLSITTRLGAQGAPQADAASPARQNADADLSGEALFTTYCAICHEGPNANPQAPTRDVMGRMSAEQVLDVLERGSMRARAAERSRAQRRAIATYVSGKPLSADGGRMSSAAFCTAAPTAPANALTGPSWNGWGLGIGNTRFQPAAAAGLTVEQIPRLQLKWAFGFPGASSAGTQPVVVGGRIYIATAEGELYVLDAKTGCLHWSLEVEASIRTAITLEQRGAGRLVAYFEIGRAHV